MAEIYFLSAYSGMTTAYNKTIGQLFDDNFLKSQFIDAMQETLILQPFIMFNLNKIHKILA